MDRISISSAILLAHRTVTWQKKRIAGPAEFSVMILRLPYLKKTRRTSREKGGPTWDDIYAGYKAFGQQKKKATQPVRMAEPTASAG